MIQRSLALVLFTALWVTRPAFAQDEELAPSSSIDNEMPPGEAPRKKAEPVEEPIAEGSIKDASEKHRPFTISAMAYMPFWYGVGIGFKTGFEIPIMHNGFIPSINDSFSLEPSFSFSYGKWNHSALYDNINVARYTPAISALWSFYFNPKFRAYASVSFGYVIVSPTGDYSSSRYNFDFNYFYHEVSVGMFYDFAKHWSLRAELGYMGLRAGVAFLL